MSVRVCSLVDICHHPIRHVHSLAHTMAHILNGMPFYSDQQSVNIILSGMWK